MLNSVSGWQPIFSGDEGRDFVGRALHLADQLRRRGRPARPSPIEEASIALFYSYCWEVAGRPDDASSVRESMKYLRAALSSDPMPPTLYGGLLGIGWVAEHLASYVNGLPENLNDEIDGALASGLESAAWQGHFDLVSGLVGVGLYSLERRTSQVAASNVQRVVDRLAVLALPQASGFAWWSPPEQLGPYKLGQYPKGCFDLGVAHGVAGVIAFLAAVTAAGMQTVRSRELADGAVSWILSHQRLDRLPFSSRFPAAFEPGGELESTRYAWCYGDPGVAAALFLAGSAFGRAEWETQALEVAREAAVCPAEKTLVSDAALCHGAAGLGHLYNRLAQASGDVTLQEAARNWLRQSVDLAEPSLYGNQSFLEGIVGVGLAWLAASTSVTPAWDRLLLLSIRS